MADKIVLLRAGADMSKHGSVAQVGTPMDLYHRPSNRFVAEFLGSPRMNFLDAVLEEATASGLKVRLSGGELISVAFEAGNLKPGSALSLGVRPEHVAPVAVNDPECCLVRPVRQVERFGEYSYVYLNADASTTFIAKVPGDCYAGVGEAMGLGFSSESCHVFDTEGLALARISANP